MTVRDDLRAKLLATRAPTTELVDFFGEKIELRQATLADILRVQDEAKTSGNPNGAVLTMLINYAYVPGTNDKIFEDTDEEVLLTMPFGGDFVNVAEALERLTKVNFRAKSSSSEPTPSSS